MLEKITKLFNHPFWDALSNFIKKFKSSKSYWSVSSLILIFTFREAIAWKFGSSIKTFCEEQAKSEEYAILWDILGFIFDVGGSIELVLLGVFFFIGVSIVKVKVPENDELIKVIHKKSAEQKEELEEIKTLIRMQGGNEILFLQKYFGEDYQKVLENPQTYHNLKLKLLDSSTNIEELLKEKDELLKKIQAQSLKKSIQKLVDQAFKELRYEDVRTILDEFINDNQVIGDDLIKAHYQKALAYIGELEYDKAKAEFEEFIPIGTKDVYILYDYAFIYYISAEYEKSLALYKKALSICRDTLFLADIFIKISHIYFLWQQDDKVLEYIDKAESIDSDYIQIDSYEMKAMVLSRQGKYDEAIELFIYILERRKIIFGEVSLAVAASYGNIGLTYHYNEDYIEALKYHKLDLSIKERVYNGRHELIGDTYLNIGFVYHDIEEYSESLVYAKKALFIYKEILGENHDSTALAYNNIYSALNKLEKYKEAYINLKKSISILENIFPSNHGFLVSRKEELMILKTKL